MNDLDLQHLQTFLVVAEEMNFSKAAERLHIAQPPLSRQIQRLEKSLNVQLFNRTKPQIQLTVAGRVLVAEAKKIFKQVDLGIQLTQRANRGEIGQLVIGFEGSSLADLVSLAVKTYRQQFPDVNIFVREMPSNEQIQALLSEKIDLGFIVPQQVGDSLIVETILQESLVVAIAQSHPLATQQSIDIQQLASEYFLVGFGDRRCGLDEIVLRICERAGFAPQLMQVTNDVQLMLGFIAADMGVTLLPESIIRFQRDGVVYLPLTPSTEKITLAIAFRSDTPCSALNNFLQVVRETSR